MLIRTEHAGLGRAIRWSRGGGRLRIRITKQRLKRPSVREHVQRDNGQSGAFIYLPAES